MDTERDFNKFLADNRGYTKEITPVNPVISRDDEWRTDDYTEYDTLRGNLDTDIIK